MDADPNPAAAEAERDRQAALRRLLVDGHPFLSALAVWATAEFGPDWVGWQPATLAAECRDAIGDDLPGPAFDRLAAAAVALGTDQVRHRPAAFQAAANCCLGGDPAAAEPADAAECLWLMTELNLLDPPDDGEPAWGPAVAAYARRCLLEDGLRRVPPAIAVAVGLGADEFPGADALLDDPAERAEAAGAAAAREDGLARFVAAGVRELLAQVAALPALPAGDLGRVRDRLKLFTEG